MLTWNPDPNISGTSLRVALDLPLDALTKLSGMNPLDPNHYYDPNNGYDGWELHGTFNGEPFQLYTRWMSLRIGGFGGLDVDGLIAALTLAVSTKAA